MRWGIITQISGDRALVDLGEQHQKPMRLPKAPSAEVGDAVAIEKIGSAHVIINIYGGAEQDG